LTTVPNTSARSAWNQDWLSVAGKIAQRVTISHVDVKRRPSVSRRDICEQLPTVAETVSAFAADGFVLHEHRRVQQITCDSLQEFAGRTKLRADTALALISDGEFLEGQRAIEKAASVARVPEPVVETIEMPVFTRHSETDARADGIYERARFATNVPSSL